MKKLITSLLCLMIAYTVYSQPSYPRTIVIDSDTVEAISRPQLRSLIALRYQADECDTERTIHQQEVTSLSALAGRQDSVFNAMQHILHLHDNEVALLHETISLKTQDLAEQKKITKRQKIKTWIGTATSFVCGGGVGVVVGIFIKK